MGLFSSSSSKNLPILNWEEIINKDAHSQSSDSTYRTKVPGGWLMSALVTRDSGLTFIPDPDHEWDGNSL